MENLEWSATTGASWIHISPTSGSGNQQITVDVTPSQVYNDPDTAGTITFTCTGCSPEIVRKVKVTRCSPTSCGEGTIEIEYPEKIELSVEQCATAATVSIPYTSTTTYTVEGCPDEIIITSDTKTFTFGKNTGITENTIKKYYPNAVSGPVKIFINQAGGEAPCDCTCDSLTLTNINPILNYEGGDDLLITTYNANNCFTSITPNKEQGTDWITNIRTEDNNKIIANVDENTTEAERRCTVTVTYGENCEQTITVTQGGYNNPCAGKDIVCVDESNDCFELNSDGGEIKLKYDVKK